MSKHTRRFRFDGDDEQILNLLAPFVKTHGKSFVKYSECELCDKAGIDVERISKAGPFLNLLHQLQPNLAFKQKQIERVVTKLGDINNNVWQLSDEQLKSWATVVRRRWQNIAHVVGKADGKEKNRSGRSSFHGTEKATRTKTLTTSTTTTMAAMSRASDQQRKWQRRRRRWRTRHHDIVQPLQAMQRLAGTTRSSVHFESLEAPRSTRCHHS